MSNASLSVIRPLVRFGSLVAPGAAGGLAFELFCRPPSRRRLSQNQAKVVAAAERRMENATRQTVNCDNGYVETYRFTPEPGEVNRGTVLLLHGWGARAAFMTAFISALTRAGFEVVAMDLPGHGESSGRRLNMPLAVDAVSAVARVFGPFHGAVGHSFGGAIAVTAAAGGVPVFAPLSVRRLALVSAPDRMVDYFRAFGGMVGLSAGAQRAMEARVLTLAGRPLECFDGGELLRTLHLPTLVVHDRDDMEIAHADAERMAAAGPHVSLASVEGLGHRRI
ncbi:MAG: alpha/beta fold hydrolase, partial [Beijerinckiaceae bacterium]